MSKIYKQSLYHSIFNFAGLFLGIINNIVIYPVYLDLEELGFVRFFVDTVLLWSPLLLMGINESSYKFFPFYAEKKRDLDSFFTIIILIQIGIFVVVVFPSLFFLDNVIDFYQKQHPRFRHLVVYIPITVGIVTLKLLFTSFVFNYKKIAFQPLLDNLIFKIALAAFSIAYYLSFINFTGFIRGMVITFLIITFIILTYFIRISHFKPRLERSFFSKREMRKFADYSIYGSLNKLGSILSQRIDVFTLGTISSLNNLAIYTQSLFIVNIMTIPKMSIFNICMPIIAKAFKDDDMTTVTQLYQKMGNLLLTLGIFIYLCLIGSIDHLFAIIPKGDIFIQGKYVIYIIGLMHIIDMSTSINQQIIAFSKFYKYNLYILFTMAIVNISLNIILIPRIGIIGAAIATAISVFFVNLFKLIFIKRKFDIIPFRKKDIYLVLLGIVSFAAIVLVKQWMVITPSIAFNLIILVCLNLIITAIFIIPAVYFQLSPELNKLIENKLKIPLSSWLK